MNIADEETKIVNLTGFIWVMKISGKLWNFIILFSKPGKSWNLILGHEKLWKLMQSRTLSIRPPSGRENVLVIMGWSD